VKVWANDAGTKRRTLDLLLNSQLLKQMFQKTKSFYRIELNRPTIVRVVPYVASTVVDFSVG
jgi:hypothetical protein